MKFGTSRQIIASGGFGGRAQYPQGTQLGFAGPSHGPNPFLFAPEAEPEKLGESVFGGSFEKLNSHVFRIDTAGVFFWRSLFFCPVSSSLIKSKLQDSLRGQRQQFATRNSEVHPASWFDPKANYSPREPPPPSNSNCDLRFLPFLWVFFCVRGETVP